MAEDHRSAKLRWKVNIDIQKTGWVLDSDRKCQGQLEDLVSCSIPMPNFSCIAQSNRYKS